MEYLTSIVSLQDIYPVLPEPVNTEKHDLGVFAKSYAIEQLRKNGYTSLAGSVTANFKTHSKMIEHLVNKITNRFADERKEQLEEICFELQISSENLQETFQTISDEMFRNNINWSRIVSFIAFSGALTLYCAEHNMQSRVPDVLRWIEDFVVERLSMWISSNGGWTGLVDHLAAGQEGLMTSLIPNIFMGAGLAAVAIAGGLLAYKKKILLN